ncbi:MAG: hypothetical protein IKP95_03700, partial [Ruminococcus sp.]|nr:hypothetical protein [Ruminococcus sp.]
AYPSYYRVNLLTLFSLPGASPPASNLGNLTKTWTSHLTHRGRAVLPKQKICTPAEVQIFYYQNKPIERSNKPSLQGPVMSYAVKQRGQGDQNMVPP